MKIRKFLCAPLILMKSLFKIVIPSLLLVVFLAVITAIGDVDYEIPVSPSTISSISFYYENLGKKKIIDSTSDISLVFDSLNNTVFHKKYDRFPTGGQTFFLVFLHTAVASGRWCGGQWPQCGLSGHHESAH